MLDSFLDMYPEDLKEKKINPGEFCENGDLGYRITRRSQPVWITSKSLLDAMVNLSDLAQFNPDMLIIRERAGKNVFEMNLEAGYESGKEATEENLFLGTFWFTKTMLGRLIKKLEQGMLNIELKVDKKDIEEYEALGAKEKFYPLMVKEVKSLDGNNIKGDFKIMGPVRRLTADGSSKTNVMTTTPIELARHFRYIYKQWPGGEI
tara:strand:+ start:89 stop:706 length:618 start_codon:yes stop_codon:yes gene_type:complete